MDSLFNITMNMAQQTSLLKDILIPLGGALATLAAGFGGVYYGAKITDKRHAKEEKERKIKQTLFLLFLIGDYFDKTLDYKTEIISKQKSAIENNEFLNDDIYYRIPYTPHAFPVDINEYLYINDENPVLLTALSSLIYLSKSLDSALKEQDSVLNNTNLLFRETVNEQLLKIRLKSLIDVIDKTCNHVLFFAHLLYKHLGMLLELRYKQAPEYLIKIQQRNLKEDAHGDKDLEDWIDGLNKSWK